MTESTQDEMLEADPNLERKGMIIHQGLTERKGMIIHQGLEKMLTL